MKLVIQAYNYGVIGGMAIYIESFINSIVKEKDLEITVLTSERCNISESKYYKIIRVPFTGGRLSLLNWSIKCKKILKEMHKRGEVDIINLHAPPVIPGLFTIKDVPYMITAHNPYYCWSKVLPYKLSFLDRILRIKLEKNMIDKALSVVTLTEEGKKALMQLGVEENKIKLIPNGTNTKIFTPKNKKNVDIVFCGRIELMKGSKAMIKLCKLLSKLKKDIKISVVGVGADYDLLVKELKSQIESGNVKMEGKVPSTDVVNYYQNAKVYVSTSYTEGLPTTCIEAMSCGLPTVVWDLNFYNGLIDDTTGCLVKLDDYDMMSKNILTLLKNQELRSKMGLVARKRIIDHYDWKRIGPSILKELRSHVK